MATAGGGDEAFSDMDYAFAAQAGIRIAGADGMFRMTL